MMMKGAYSVILVLALLGCVAGQLSFRTFHPRAGTRPDDDNAPCGGHSADYNIVANNTSGNFTFSFKVEGNHGAPNQVIISESTIFAPLTQASFTALKTIQIPDGDISVRDVDVRIPRDTVKTFQFFYQTGGSIYYYCVDVQNGDYKEDISTATALTFSAMVFLSTLLYVLVL